MLLPFMNAPLPLSHRSLSRRSFLGSTALLALPALSATAAEAAPEPIIDIHQHTNYKGRTNEQLIAHQKAMGVTRTFLLPAGTPMQTPSTHNGKSNGLAAGTGANQTCTDLSFAHPETFFFFANEVTDSPLARKTCETFLLKGARGIGEQKFSVEVDSAASQELYRLAQDYEVPILLHFQHNTYNLGYERFHTMLEKYPKVTFIGHAQTMWGYIDKAHQPKDLYPKGKVTPGGITDRYLSDYPNFFADMSAGSGLNALLRDEEHTRWFLEKHQRKILYGSDCNDTFGRGPGCQGAQTIAAIRKYAASRDVERNILYENARKLFGL